MKVGIQYASGGVPAIDQPEYGSLLNWSAALVVILVTLGLKFYARGMLAVSAVLLGIIAGIFLCVTNWNDSRFESIGSELGKSLLCCVPIPI